MKKLILVRHGKTENATSLGDHARKLLPIGKDDAMGVGKRLLALNIKPDLILASTAARAKETVSIIGSELKYSEESIIYMENIYCATIDNLMDIVKSIDNAMSEVLLVGHNPGFTEAANYFLGEFKVAFSTCGYCCFEFETDNWSKARYGKGKLLFQSSPKDKN